MTYDGKNEICRYIFNWKIIRNKRIVRIFRYWKNGTWKLIEQNSIVYVSPMDGEVFAGLINMSTGFQVILNEKVFGYILLILFSRFIT